MIFIATSVWGSSSFWDSLGLEGFALFAVRRFPGLAFIIRAILIHPVIYFNFLILPILRYAIIGKLAKGAIRNDVKSLFGPGNSAGGNTCGKCRSQRKLSDYGG